MNVIARTRVRYHRARTRWRLISALLHGRSVLFGVRLEAGKLTMLYPGGTMGDVQIVGNMAPQGVYGPDGEYLLP